MADKLNLQGAQMLGSFVLKGKAPLDAKTVVNNYDDLDLLNNTGWVYEGLTVYIKELKKYYYYDGSDWVELVKSKYTKPAAGIPKADLDSSVQASLGKADTALQSHQTITIGSVNGTIAVAGEDIAVNGLGSAAYEAKTAFATADQGTKADNALPKATYDNFIKTVNDDAIADAKQAGIDAATALEKYIDKNDKAVNANTDAIDKLQGAIKTGINFKGKFDSKPTTDDYNNGDLIIINKKEFILYDDNTAKEWIELGDEGSHLTKTAADEYYVPLARTIAGADLKDNVTKAELQAALNIADGATKVIESTVSDWGFTKNEGTVTGVKINGESKVATTGGIVDLGTVVTDISTKQDILEFNTEYNESTNKAATMTDVNNVIGTDKDDANAITVYGARAYADSILTGGDVDIVGDVNNLKKSVENLENKHVADKSVAQEVTAGIEALDLANTYAAKGVTEAHIADVDIHVTAVEKEAWDKVITDVTTLNGEEETSGSVKAIAKQYTDPKQDAITDGSAIIATVSNDIVTLKAGVKQTNGAVGQGTGADIALAKVAKTGAAADIAVADKGNKFTATNLEAVLAELADNVQNGGTGSKVTCEKSTLPPDGIAARYIFKQGNVAIDNAVIDIPKDMVVKEGSVVENPEGQPAGTYLRLILANTTEDTIYINVNGLIEYVTSGSIDEDSVQIAISNDHKVTAFINDNSVTLGKLVTTVQEQINKAHEHKNKNVLDNITQEQVNKWKALDGDRGEEGSILTKLLRDDLQGGPDDNTAFSRRGTMNAITNAIDARIGNIETLLKALNTGKGVS